MTNSLNSDTYSCQQCNASIPQELYSANFCPKCCALSPSYKALLVDFFKRAFVLKELDEAVRQYLKGEYVSAARTATIILENEVKKESCDDGKFGVDLMSNALLFTYDSNANTVTKMPKIKLNDLSTNTKRNEQEGMKFLCMGLMAGCRNVFAHSHGHAAPEDCLSVVLLCNFALKQMKHKSIAEQLHKDA